MDILKTALLGGTVFTFISCGAQSHKQNMNAESEELTRIEMSVPVFEEDSAYKYMQQQVDFGFRIPNTTAHRATAEFLRSWDVMGQMFLYKKRELQLIMGQF